MPLKAENKIGGGEDDQDSSAWSTPGFPDPAKC